MFIGNGKTGVRVGEYGPCEDGNGILGWIEPAGKSPQWIMWFTRQGDALLYTERDSTGAVKGEPIRVKAR